jgi:hypothetical protein
VQLLLAVTFLIVPIVVIRDGAKLRRRSRCCILEGPGGSIVARLLGGLLVGRVEPDRATRQLIAELAARAKEPVTDRLRELTDREAGGRGVYARRPW